MGTRKPIQPPAGPTCPDCKRLAAELARLHRQHQKQATDLRHLELLLVQEKLTVSEAQKQLAGWQKWADDARLFLSQLQAKHLASTSSTRYEMLELRQLLKTRTVGLPQMPDGTATLHPN